MAVKIDPALGILTKYLMSNVRPLQDLRVLAKKVVKSKQLDPKVIAKIIVNISKALMLIEESISLSTEVKHFKK